MSEQEDELLLNVAADPDGDLLTYVAASRSDGPKEPRKAEQWQQVLALIVGLALAAYFFLLR
jgi:hypothetical protein